MSTINDILLFPVSELFILWLFDLDLKNEFMSQNA